MKKLLFIALVCLFILPVLLSAQRMEIDTIITDNYPTMRAEFRAYDDADFEIRDYTDETEFTLTENGVDKPLDLVYCEPKKSRFSLILCVDRTGSMNEPVDKTKSGSPIRRVVAQKALIELIRRLPPGRSNCAITSFSFTNAQGSKLEHDFSSDTLSLIDSVRNIKFQGGTDYNKGFLGVTPSNPQRPGSIEMAERAPFYPIIIFLTDGEHDENNGIVEVGEITAAANAVKNGLGARVYAVTLGLAVPPELESISSGTGGEAFSDLSGDLISSIYLDILRAAEDFGEPVPCHLEWETDCDGGGDVELTLDRFGGLSDTKSYNIPPSLLPRTEISPNNFAFLNGALNVEQDTTITICAEQNEVIIDGFSSDDPRYTIDWGTNPPPITLDAGMCIDVDVKYTPDDRICSKPDFNLTGNICSGNEINAEGGFVYSEDVNMGSTPPGTPKELEVDQVLCNHTCNPVRVTNLSIAPGPQNTHFGVVTATPFDIPPGECVKIKFRYLPPEEGNSTAEWVALVDGNQYRSQINGSGSGSPEIQTAPELTFEDLDCNTPQRCVDFTIENIGSLPLDISDINISDAVFTVNPTSLSVAPGESETVQVCFTTTDIDPINATMTINSNAKAEPARQVTLNGKYLKHDFDVENLSIDLGQICPGEQPSIDFFVNNTGTSDIDISLTESAGISLISPTPFTITTGGQEQIIADFLRRDNEGPINETITLTDDICGKEITVNIIGDVVMPHIVGPTTVFQATVGSFDDKTITLTNNSTRDATITTIATDNPEFTVISPSLPPDIPIAAGGTIDITVRYEPVVDAASAYLIIEGTPCNVLDSVALNGGADLATAEIKIDQYSGLIGETITIDVELINKFRFAESGATMVDFKLSFNGELLEPVPISGTMNGITRTLDVSFPASGNNDETLPLTFLVLDGNGATSTDLSISNPTPDGAVVITPVIGTFNLVEASADFRTDPNFSADPGQIIEVPLFINNSLNVTDFHQGITTTISFNSTILEPIFIPDADDIQPGGMRTVTVKNLPLPSGPGEFELSSLQFRAMLGNVLTSDIKIENTVAQNGYVEFSEQSGTFLLTGVCEEGSTLRLFDPTGTRNEILTPAPHPVSSDTELAFSTREKGNIRLEVIDVSGRTTHVLFEGYLERGEHLVPFRVSELETGTYLIVLKSPRHIETARIEVVK